MKVQLCTSRPVTIKTVSRGIGETGYYEGVREPEAPSLQDF
jgi:hypothetical protein